MKFFLISILSFVISISVFSQSMKARLNENTVVKDSSGNVYPYNIWRNALLLGTVKVKPVDPSNENSDFLLTPMTEEERSKWLSTVKPRESSYFTTGKTIETFKTTDIDRNKINLKDLKGKIIVINFWFINCQPCRMEMPELNRIVNEYKDSNVVFLAIALDNENDLRYFLKQTSFNYTIIDSGKWIADLYGIKAYPTHVILDKEGKVYFHTSGYSNITTRWIKKSIEELMK